MTVVQHGGLFQLVGSDNLCGASAPAPLVGTAVPTATGVALGLTVSLNSGAAGHVSAAVNLATLSGTWADADGHTGGFVFGGNSGGTPRPAPLSSTAITPAQLAPTVYAGSGTAATVARSDHLHDERYYTESESDLLLAGKAASSHQHDERYYTESESDLLLAGKAASGEIVTAVPATTFTFTAENGASGQTVTTTKAGRLLLRMNVGLVSVSCTPVQTSAILFLTIDGSAVPGSVTNLPDTGGTFSTVLVGVTDGVVAAGAHSVAAGIECLGVNTPLVVGVNNPRSVTAIVIP